MALIKQHLNIEAICTPGNTGQFDVIADGEKVAERGGNFITRSFGAGYPDLEKVVHLLAERNRAGAPVNHD